MLDLQGAVASGDILIMAGVGAALGLIHTVLGPDHYLPFVMMARAEGWSRRKTGWITFLCGLGHVGSSVAIGAGLAAAGTAASAWVDSRWAGIQEMRGSVAAWLLIGTGAALFVWGWLRARRGRTHTHVHLHEDGERHAHRHHHEETHRHAHADAKGRRLTPWILFTIFIFGPCESLIPLMLAAWAAGGLGGAALVAGAFSLTTVAAIMGTVFLLLTGISRLPLHGLERWSLAAAGLSLVLCGAAIEFIGL
jgi:ABC-type nickel/cobalt efflux system permease component RcnA